MKNEIKKKPITKVKKSDLIIIILTIILTTIDLILKYLLKGDHFYLTKDFGIVYVLNRGSAFSLFYNLPHYNRLIILISLIVIYFIIKYRDKISWILQIFLLSGILSNLYDRIFFQTQGGAVRDYILTPFFTFNLADFYLTFAGIIIIYNYLTKKTIFK